MSSSKKTEKKSSNENNTPEDLKRHNLSLLRSLLKKTSSAPQVNIDKNYDVDEKHFKANGPDDSYEDIKGNSDPDWDWFKKEKISDPIKQYKKWKEYKEKYGDPLQAEAYGIVKRKNSKNSKKSKKSRKSKKSKKSKK